MINKISQQLEQREVPLCVVCGENPQREGCKTCSPECSKAYQKACKRTYQKAHQRALFELARQHREEFNKLLKSCRRNLK